MRLFVQAKAETPIAFRSGRSSRQETTLTYIPGSALLGGLSVAHSLSKKESEFADFFLLEKVLYRNLYPAKISDLNKSLIGIFSPIRPLPRTSFSCKRFSGFQFNADIEQEERHGVLDSLIAWAAFALNKDTNLLFKLRDCSCGEPRDAFSGFYKQKDTANEFAITETSKGLFTRTGISRKRGSATEGILYSREFLSSGSEFYGELWVDDAIFKGFESFLEDISDSGLLRVGHNRTRGLGALVFPSYKTNVFNDSAKDIEDRTKNFSLELRKATKDTKYQFYLPITLISDCIYPDLAGRYYLQLNSKIMEKDFHIKGAELIYCNATTHQIAGWSSLWGLPKADELAIAMGSVFLFGLKEEPNWQVLASVQEKGIGSRLTEGFGVVRIADEFHIKGINVL